MARRRILVVDDSVVMRKVLSDALADDPDLDVVGTANNGRICLEKIGQLTPDIVTLDIEMPVMDGLETLKEIRKLYPKLPVIMYSSLTERGATATLDALAAGASDYATKPTSTGNPETALASVRSDLIPKIKALCGLRGGRAASASRSTQRPRKAGHPRIEIVVIGTSTGGPNALAELLPKIPKTLPVPIAIVQHMPPMFTRHLADRLSRDCQLAVGEAFEGSALNPGQAWIAPGDFHMTVKSTLLQATLSLNQGPPEHSCRPAVDVLFRSAAAAYGAHVLGVVLTGMGSDGVLGAQRIREAGGGVIVQDEASSVVWGMPGSTFESGNADAVFPLNQLAKEITRRVLESRAPRTALESQNLTATDTSTQ